MTTYTELRCDSSITQFENQWTFGLKDIGVFGGSANSHIQPPEH